MNDGLKTHKSHTILLTRPQGQNQELRVLLEQEAAQVYELPTIEIKPLDPPHLPRSSTNQDYDRVIFISSNAVKFGWSAVDSLISKQTELFAIGKASALELIKQSQRPVMYPTNKSDSEALLDMPEWQRVSGLKVLICRGQGGREWLKGVLEERGAQVDYIECYIRGLPETNLSTLDNAIASQAVILIMSKESLNNLWASLDTLRIDQLKNMIFLVCHERVKEYAKELGIKSIFLTDHSYQSILKTWRHITT
ncbi:MAG: hypothetical protein B7Z65_05155 [Ferrovum sp. 21-44-67]|uniref:uroporphyrinogen-III synthase n=1 Tax=Ferrovum sp. JA12 TaxID=1356299 RepID=UPI0007037CEB|nr:uroporphyrinogen-III synthase [Ferrovum sp. JA12]KRH79429.1 uroporphyrinogen-III synthase [Ferrovum sp. JA12]OYV79542.1 MAG: hypothetical protein B7Z65_05155 [Ferrovum sp. 21-44-67]HQU06347.1 uroporphyrinogen-III synthase [Ferrovaceae bacterium]